MTENTKIRAVGNSNSCESFGSEYYKQMVRYF